MALLLETDAHHAWAVEQIRHAPVTVRTCEAVIAEALFLFHRDGRDGAALFELMDAGLVQCDFSFRDERRNVATLVRRYADRPMSFADACLVRMAELDPQASIWTLDRDFAHYRRDGRHTLSLVTPW